MRALKRVISKVAGKIYCGASEKGSLRQEAYASRSSSVIVGCPACFAPTALAHAKVNMALLERGPSHVPQTDSRERLFHCNVYQSLRTSHGPTHALVSPLYYTTHHSCITRYILHTQYDPHLAGVLGRGSRSLNPPAAVLVLRCPKGICKKSLLTKIPF